jgi:hypothetical protein
VNEHRLARHPITHATASTAAVQRKNFFGGHYCVRRIGYE